MRQKHCLFQDKARNLSVLNQSQQFERWWDIPGEASEAALVAERAPQAVTKAFTPKAVTNSRSACSFPVKTLHFLELLALVFHTLLM